MTYFLYMAIILLLYVLAAKMGCELTGTDRLIVAILTVGEVISLRSRK